MIRFNYSNTVSTPQLLLRGWTKAMIKESGIKPSTYRLNPRFRNGAPMKLYYIKKVERIENSEWFGERLTVANKRREACAKGLETKKKKKRLKYLTETIAKMKKKISRLENEESSLISIVDIDR